MTNWQSLLDENELILADGAMGTMLFDAGLQFGDPPERWNLDHPDVVQRVHRGYLEAGAKILLTNTFGGNRFRLGMHGLDGNVAELNRAAADVAREAVRVVGNGVLVAGDIGPSGRILAPLGDMEFSEAADGFAEQAAALAGAGVDLFWIETMSDLEEVHAAIEGVRRAAGDMPVITTMTFDTRGRTMMGVTPEEAARALLGWGSLAVGGNCGNGPDEIEAVVRKMHTVAPDAVLVAKANAGIPRLVQGRAVYGAGPAEMAQYALAVVRAGARIVGACCGSTPAHLEAMAEALAKERAASEEST
jgi:5-methyltetrahydrofolate--homocysteine methyltransferase